MKITDSLNILLQFLVFLPFSLLCYLPMKNHLKRSRGFLFRRILLILSIVAAVGTLCSSFFHLNTNLFFVILIITFFLWYQNTLDICLECALVVYISVCDLMAFTGNLSYVFDAGLHPLSTAAEFSLEASLFRFVFASVLVLLIFYPVHRFGTHLIDSLDFHNIWSIFLPIPLSFLIFNLITIPHKYETLYTNNVFPMYLLFLCFSQAFFLYTHVIFYRVSIELLANTADRERIRFFEMQEAQYLAQRNYIQETEKLRHDFRQSLHVLRNLSEGEDWQALKVYLKQYEESFPASTITRYCSSPAVNALLNYYSYTASQEKIRLKWEIALPSSLPLPDPDLCSLLGNILENAITGCRTTKEETPYHYFSITLKNRQNLYIVSINSFDGQVRQKENRYLSTKGKGNGIGISSIRLTAEKYHGVAKFSHTDRKFTADVMLRLPK